MTISIANLTPSVLQNAFIGEASRQGRTAVTEKQIEDYAKANRDWIDRISGFTSGRNGRLFNSEGEELLLFDNEEQMARRLEELSQESYTTRKDLITLIEQRNQTQSPVRPAILGSSPISARQLIVGSSRKVTFKVMPDVNENKSVSYIPITDIRSAGSIHIFIGSPGRTFGINAKLVSRTEEEARENFKYLHLLKGWTVPEKGYQSRGANGSGIDSDTPRIVHLYGYGQQLKGIPTVLTSLGITYPSDVDYIKFQTENVGDGSKPASIPIVMSLDIQLQEVRSADELTGDGSKSSTAFDIKKYKNGELGGW